MHKTILCCSKFGNWYVKNVYMYFISKTITLSMHIDKINKLTLLIHTNVTIHSHCYIHHCILIASHYHTSTVPKQVYYIHIWFLVYSLLMCTHISMHKIPDSYFYIQLQWHSILFYTLVKKKGGYTYMLYLGLIQRYIHRREC